MVSQTPVPGGLEAMERVNAYNDFQKSEGIPVYGGFAIDDLRTVELGNWARKGGRGAYINLDGTGGTNDAYVCEIPAGGTLNPERHMFEEMVYVLDGSGATTVWYDASRKVSFEWKAGSLFAIPLNANFQHFNGQGSRTARFLSVTNLPVVLNLFHNPRFVFEDSFVFDDRFGGQDDYFSNDGKLYQRRVLETNFVSDVNTIPLHEWKERGAGGRNVMFELAHNTMAAHISEFPVGTYKKAHRHGPGAHVIILNGTGFSLLWPQGSDMEKVDWHTGSMVVPPDRWFHEHFNSGTEPARYLALRWGSQRYDTGGVFSADARLADVSVKDGGLQIEYGDEDPKIHQIFEEELRNNGAVCRMKTMIDGCTGVE
jgi:quercetin dioxygenase-like cupin family protein/oxalate decarboxylase/phosphoglucose isomerase-like protein (cupin superfamily)